MPLQVTIETITPQIAETYLATNDNVRKVTWGVVAKYAEDMKNGRWKLSSETIAFDEHGCLKDGQHRLHACVKSGCSFQTLVVRGLEAGADSVIDIGKLRSASDQLKGMEYSDKIATLAKYACATKTGSVNMGITTFLQGRSGYGGKNNVHKQVSIPELVDDAKENSDEYLLCAKLGNRLHASIGKFGVAIYAYFIWLIRWLGEGDQIEVFVDDFTAKQSKSLAVATAKDCILKNKEQKDKNWLIAVLLYAYGAYCDGNEISVVRQPLKALDKWNEKIREKKGLVINQSQEEADENNEG